MLFAIDKNNIRYKATMDASKEIEYCCPICKDKVILKKGEFKKPHFAHISKNNCIYTLYYKEKTTSTKHKKMINTITQLFSSYIYVKNIEIEKCIIPNRISDMVITLKNDIEIVVQCEYEKISFDMYREITKSYNEKGYAVLWVFDDKIIDNLSRLASCYINKKGSIYSFKKGDNNSLEKDYLNKESAIYLNKRIINFDGEKVTRIGIGSMKSNNNWIYAYDLKKEDVKSIL